MKSVPTPGAQYPDLKGRAVLITGGANGIGAAMVRAFAQQGARVFFCDRDAKAGQKLAGEISGDASFSPVELKREKDIVRWVNDSAAKSSGSLGALINNAAIDPRCELGKMTAERWDELFALNLRSYFLAARECAPHLGQGGCIVNFSSITWHAGPANMTAYVASKAGILGFTRSLARELGPRGIRVNAISPGWIMTKRQLAEYVTPAVKRLIRKSQCVPQLIEPEEIAEVALFLASNASRAITGQEILADRGWQHS